MAKNTKPPVKSRSARKTKTAKPPAKTRAAKTASAPKKTSKKPGRPAADLKSKKTVAKRGKAAAPRSSRAAEAGDSQPRTKKRLRLKIQTTCDPELLELIDRDCARTQMKRSRWYEMAARNQLLRPLARLSPSACRSASVPPMTLAEPQHLRVLPRPQPRSLSDIPPRARSLRWVAWAAQLGASLTLTVTAVTGPQKIGKPQNIRHRYDLIALAPDAPYAIYGAQPRPLVRHLLGHFREGDPDTYQELLAKGESLLTRLRDPLLAVELL